VRAATSIVEATTAAATGVSRPVPNRTPPDNSAAPAAKAKSGPGRMPNDSM
jgi:hypothetical protein